MRKRKEKGTAQPAASVFDSLASEYDAWFDSEGKLAFAMEVEAFRSASPFLARPWLEIGAGSGRFAQALGIEYGLDPSRRLLDLARKRIRNVFLGRGEEMPFKSGTFGTAFLIVTLCFVRLPLEVLLEANRVLKEDGKIVLGLVLRDSPWGRLYGKKKEEGHRFYKDATFYSFDEVKAFLRQAGFAIEGVLSTLFQKPGEVNHVEPPQEGFSNAAGFVVIWAKKSRGALNKGERMRAVSGEITQ